LIGEVFRLGNDGRKGSALVGSFYMGNGAKRTAMGAPFCNLYIRSVVGSREDARGSMIEEEGGCLTMQGGTWLT